MGDRERAALSKSHEVVGRRWAWRLGLVLVLAAARAQGATIVVDTTADDLDVNANCTLREAIEAANTNVAVDGCTAGEASPTIDRIEIPAGVYNLTIQTPGSVEDANQEGDLDISEEVDIVGAGMDLTAIDGQSSERVLDIQVANLTVLSTIRDLEVRNGYADNGIGGGSGGGIRLLGNLYMYFCRVTGNTSYAAPGGGIFHGTTGSVLEVYDSEISDNHALSMSGASGGISAVALLKLYRCTVSGNSAAGSAGGIGNGLASTRIYNTTVSGNSATLYGGGVSGKIVNIYNSTIVGNSAAGGFGANLQASGSPGNMTVQNSIVADPVGGTNCLYGGGAVITSAGGNFESPGDTCNFIHATDTTDVVLADLGLTQLLALGGPTQTHGLFPDSIAVDTTNPGCEALDQRSETRSDGLCDAGSFEVQPGEDVGIVYSSDFEDGTFGDWIVVGG